MTGLQRRGNFPGIRKKTTSKTLFLKNIVLVLSGHVTQSSSLVSTGENGNKIYQILQDYQNEDAGGGYLRLLKINPQAGTISGEMYTPFYKKYRKRPIQGRIQRGEVH